MSYLIDRAMEAQKRKIDLKREEDDRAAVASGNVDENSALYRHAKLSGWDTGKSRYDKQMEMQDHLNMMRETHDIRRGDQPRRSSISAFSADGEGNFTYYGEDSALRAGFDGIMRNANAQRADRARRGRNVLGTAVGYAMDNGGMTPAELGPSIGAEVGDPSFMGGTLASDGTYMTLGRGRNGLQATGLVSPTNVLKSMVESGNYKAAQKYAKKYMDGRYTPEQISQMTGYSPEWAAQAQRADLDTRKQKEMLGLQEKIINIAEKMRKGDGMDDMSLRKWVLSNKELQPYIFRGKPMFDEDNKPALDMDGNPQYHPATASEIKQNIESFVGLIRNPESAKRFDPANAFVNGWMNRLYPEQTPEQKEMAQIQQNAALERTKLNDRARQPPELVYFRDSNGVLKAMNGSVQDGKVYDRRGYEIVGATPMYGRQVQTGGGNEFQFSEFPTQERAVPGVVDEQAVQASQAAAPVAEDGSGGYFRGKDGKVWKIVKSPDGRSMYKIQLKDQAAGERVLAQAEGANQTNPPAPDNAEGARADTTPAAAEEKPEEVTLATGEGEDADVYAPEMERRLNNGRQQSAAQGTEDSPALFTEPLSDTPLWQIPAALAVKGGRALLRGSAAYGQMKQREAEAISDVASSSARATGRLASLTPKEILQANGLAETPMSDSNQIAAQRYYSKKFRQEQEKERRLSDIRAAITSTIDNIRRSERDDATKEIVLARLAEAADARKRRAEELAQTRAQSEEEKAVRKQARADAKEAQRIHDLYASGDIDAIAKEIERDNEIMAFLEDLGIAGE